jgi:formate dehydrogenase major subunit
VVSEKIVPGVVYTTFHFPETGANIVTTDNSDWATNCPEYKVTAVQVVRLNQRDAWQRRTATGEVIHGSSDLAHA